MVFTWILNSQEVPAQLIRNFVLGGAVVASTSYLATFFNPLVGAIWWSYPFTIMPTIYFLKENKKSKEYIGKFLFSTVFAFILLIACVIIIRYYLNNTKNTFFYCILKASGWWLLLAIIFYIACLNTDIKNYLV